MPKKGGKKGKRPDESSSTPRENEVSNDIIQMNSQDQKEEVKPQEATVPAEVIEVQPKVQEDAPVVEEQKDEIVHEQTEAPKKQTPRKEKTPRAKKEKTPRQEKAPKVEEQPKEEKVVVQEPEPVKEEPVVDVVEPVKVVDEPVAPKVEEPVAPVVQQQEEKQPEPADFVKANDEGSGFVVVGKKEESTKQKDVEIKPDHVAVQQSKTVGIKAMSRDIHPEIQSPFRKKKTQGGLKLSVIQQDPIIEEPNNEEEHRFDQILPYWDQVLANLAISKQKFEDLKQEPLEYHCKMYRDGDYKTLVKRWSTTLELQIPKGTSIDNETLTLFNQKVKTTLSEIARFINVLQDWVESKIHQLEDEAPAELLEKQVEETKEDDDDHVLEAERMGISSKDPQELKGLVREASLRIERGEPALIKKQPSKSEKSAQKVEKEEGKKDESNDESTLTPYLVIGAAIAVAAGVYAFKAFAKK